MLQKFEYIGSSDADKKQFFLTYKKKKKRQWALYWHLI